ncbi:hypothetical protein [Metamycoplasma alkalescens]|uniref:hypothetical protein n=1 Tax=Metamycoplasma alkalescens TaxID=45363 RepID=UPI0003A822C7|nr:hypothetical protein [Metamycoplasma alkalescens]
MYLNSLSHSYDQSTSQNNNLTFDYVEKKFSDCNKEFTKRALPLINKSNVYNNAALVLSDQNSFITKFAIYEGKDNKTFLNKIEIRDSIVKQIEEILYLIGLSNKKKINITNKGSRKEIIDYPEPAN